MSNINEFLQRVIHGEDTTSDDIEIPKPNKSYSEYSSTIPMTPVKSPKKEKMKRLYEDDDFIIDLFPEEPMVRVSIFEDNHFQDEVFVRKESE